MYGVGEWITSQALPGKAHFVNAAMWCGCSMHHSMSTTSHSLQELRNAVAALTRMSPVWVTHTLCPFSQPATTVTLQVSWNAPQCSVVSSATGGALPLLPPNATVQHHAYACQDYTIYIQQQQQQRSQPESCMPSKLTTQQAARSSQPCSCFAGPSASTKLLASSTATPACPVHGRLHIQPPWLHT